MRRRDGPLPLHLGEFEVHDGDPHAPFERLGQEHLLAGGLVGDEAFGDLQVGVADQDGVDAGDFLGELGGGVLGERQGIAVGGSGRRPGMTRDDHDVRAGGFHLWDDSPGLFDDAVEVELALDVVAVPQRAARRHEADEAHRHPAVVRLDPLQDVGGERAPARHGVVDVGAQEREVQLLLPGAQEVNAVVELVVAQPHGVVADRVHGQRHGVFHGCRDGLDLGEVVGQGRALDGVPGVDGQRVRRAALGPQGIDQGGGLGNPDLVPGGVGIGDVLEVVPVEDVVVQVGGAEHGQRELLLGTCLAAGLSRFGLGCRGSGQRGCGGAPAHERCCEHGAAGGGIMWVRHGG